MTIVLFEDNQCEKLYPLGLYKPLFDLSVGSLTLRSVVERLNVPVTTLVRGYLLPEVTRPQPLDASNGPLFFLNASICPDIRYLERFRDIIAAGDPFVTTSGNRVSAALVPQGTDIPATISPTDIRPFLLELGLPLEDSLFVTIDWPHEAVKSHLDIFEANLAALIAEDGYEERAPGFFTGKNVELAPSTVVETDSGPVVLEDNVRVRHFTHLAGPLHIGPNSQVIEYASIKDRTAIGHTCKIGGELEGSVISAYSNKQHHGFLGHSYVGEWVNFGAGTTSSDLKNTYGIVRVAYGGRRVETGMQFFGTVIGDYAKTAINTSIFTGKIVGVCSMVYGTVSSNVPSFCNYAKSFGQVTEISLDQIITTQQRMFQRRGVEQSAEDIALMRRVFDMTRHERVMGDEQINF